MACIKRQYKSDLEAILMVNHQIQHRPGMIGFLRTYQCPWCYFWHLTSQLPRMKKGKKHERNE